VPGSASGLVFGWSPGAVKLERDRKFQIGFGLVLRGKKGYRASERVLTFQPALHVITRVLGDEFLRHVAVIEIANRERIIIYLLRNIRTFRIAQILLDEFVDPLGIEVLSRRRRLGRRRRTRSQVRFFFCFPLSARRCDSDNALAVSLFRTGTSGSGATAAAVVV